MVTALTRKNGFLVGLQNLDEPPALSVSDIRDGEDR